jgi:hypothetical protein
MREKFLSAMEKVALKMISMWQVDLVIGLAGVAIFYLIQRWREKKTRREVSPQVIEREGGVGVSPTDEETGSGLCPQRRVRESTPGDK